MSGLLNKVKPGSRQNRHSFQDTGQYCTEKGHILFTWWKNTCTYQQEKKKILHSLTFLAHKTKLNQENPLLVESHCKYYAILNRKSFLPLHFSLYWSTKRTLATPNNELAFEVFVLSFWNALHLSLCFPDS